MYESVLVCMIWLPEQGVCTYEDPHNIINEMNMSVVTEVLNFVVVGLLFKTITDRLQPDGISSVMIGVDHIIQ